VPEAEALDHKVNKEVHALHLRHQIRIVVEQVEEHNALALNARKEKLCDDPDDNKANHHHDQIWKTRLFIGDNRHSHRKRHNASGDATRNK
jgi:hypothetical protein